MTVADPLAFMFASPADPHIRLGSVAAGQAQSTPLSGESLFDIVGDLRAVGSATVDIGADEIR